MKVHWHDLTSEEQATFGNGCSWVPDFIFTANCRQHDFNYTRGGYLKDKIKADFELCVRIYTDSLHHRWWFFYQWIGIVYFLGLTLLPFSYIAFDWGRWRTKEEILERDMMNKSQALL